MPRTITQPGFQGSETSRIEVTFYRHGNDPVIVTPSGQLPAKGRRAQDELPSLIGASTSKAMGMASGSFMLQLKPSRATKALFDQLVDDNWVDLVVYRHDQPWHVMRGLVDEIRRTRTVSGSGATSEVYTITGRDFGKIWEITPIWFSPYGNDVVTNSVAKKVFGAMSNVLGDPGTAVQAFLKGFLEKTTKHDGPNWEPPPGVPNVEAGSFINSIEFKVGDPYFQNLPKRKGFSPEHLNPQGTLWTLAQQYSDPAFTEFYVDLLPDGDPFSGKISAGDALAPKDMQMTVVLRDKPFLVVDPFVMNQNYKPQWDKVPVLTVPRQQIITSNLGRSGLERFNAYFVSAMIHQETMREAGSQLLAPLLDRVDLKRHGFRRMDVTSSCTPDEANLDSVNMAESQRRIMRDWYALNPYMLNGSMSLSLGRPDIRIGCRVRVPASEGEDEEESYYVEEVSHTWTFGASVKTNLGVTRGWRGDDASYSQALQDQSDKYEAPILKPDKEVSGG